MDPFIRPTDRPVHKNKVRVLAMRDNLCAPANKNQAINILKKGRTSIIATGILIFKDTLVSFAFDPV